jgi:hypothetical protein
MSKNRDIPASAADRKRARRRRAREITEAWREKAAVDGRPQARDADGAIAEAIAFLTVSSGEPVIYLADIVEAATMCLQREGFDRLLSKRVITSRLKPRPEHDLAGVIPSLGGVDDLARVHPPRNNRSWTAKDVDRLNELVGHTPNTTAPSAPPLPPHTAYGRADGR